MFSEHNTLEALALRSCRCSTSSLCTRAPSLTSVLVSCTTARSLDENLHTRQGPARSFLILARYCSRTVYEEELETILGGGGGGGASRWRPHTLLRLFAAWAAYARVGLRLTAYEWYLRARSVLGVASVAL